MAVLSWGKCTIKHSPSTAGEPTNGEGATWTVIDTPKEGTTKITGQKGDKKEAKEEGGATVDVRYGASTAQLVFTHFLKKDGTPFVSDHDGIIPGEHAFQIIPEDADCIGVQIDASTGSVEKDFSSDEGILFTYTFDVLKPKTGDMVKFKKIS